MSRRLLWPILVILSNICIPTAQGQKIIDPCFISVQELGFFYGSDDVRNVCNCIDYKLATDMMEWDGDSWEGIVANNVLELAPPPGCNTRAMWMGETGWTPGGEGFSLRLDEPLEEGKTYSYTFTYASDGNGSDGNFSPKLYTNNKYELIDAIYIGRMPGVDGWTTNSFTFTAQPSQSGHNWLILYAFESSGMVMSECDVQKLYPDDANLLGDDKLICEGDSIILSPPVNKNYEYMWNTGSQNPNITVHDPGEYNVTIQYGDCSAYSSVTVATEDCEVRLVMPNIFTPNGDSLNPLFVPKEHNYINSGTTHIYNRWGTKIFKGELFSGWSGLTNSGISASNGVYYYVVYYMDKTGKSHELKGPLTLVR